MDAPFFNDSTDGDYNSLKFIIFTLWPYKILAKYLTPIKSVLYLQN